MRIGVIADTHIPERAETIPLKALNDLKTCDLILHAGDLVSPEVLTDLRKIAKQVKAVWGNMDPPQVRSQLPEKEFFTLEGVKIGLTHGYGPPLKLINLTASIFKKEKPDIIIFGHSHHPINERKENTLYFNPGSLTDKIFSPYNSYGILEIDSGKIKSAKIIRIS